MQSLPRSLSSQGKVWGGGSAACAPPVSDHGVLSDRVLSGYGLGARISAIPAKSPAEAGPEAQRERSGSGSQCFVGCSLTSCEIDDLACDIEGADIRDAAIDAFLLCNGDGLDVGVLDAAVLELHGKCCCRLAIFDTDSQCPLSVRAGTPCRHCISASQRSGRHALPALSG